MQRNGPPILPPNLGVPSVGPEHSLLEKEGHPVAGQLCLAEPCGDCSAVVPNKLAAGVRLRWHPNSTVEAASIQRMNKATALFELQRGYLCCSCCAFVPDELAVFVRLRWHPDSTVEAAPVHRTNKSTALFELQHGITIAQSVYQVSLYQTTALDSQHTTDTLMH